MLDFLHRIGSLALFLLVIAVWIAIASWYFSPCHNQTYDQTSAPNQQNECASVYGIATVGYAAGWNGIISRKAESWTAIATILIAAFTLTLWWTTWGQLSHLRDSVVISNRAWVFTQPWPRSVEFCDNGNITISKMEVRLYGESPARITELYVDFIEEPGRKPTFRRKECIVRQTYILAPGNQWFHRQNFTTNEAKPYVFGYVRYVDQFKKKRESRYCYRLVKEAVKIRTAGGAAWSRFT